MNTCNTYVYPYFAMNQYLYVEWFPSNPVVTYDSRRVWFVQCDYTTFSCRCHLQLQYSHRDQLKKFIFLLVSKLVYSKTKIYSKNNLIFMKVEGIFNHVISYNMNHVWIPCVSQPYFGWSGRMKLPLPKLGIWSPPGLPNF